MNKKILLGSIIAVVILVLVSFTGVVGYQTTKSTTIARASPLFTVRSSRAIDEESKDIACDYVGKGGKNTIWLPNRGNKREQIKKIIDIIKKMDDKAFRLFIQIAIEEINQKNIFSKEIIQGQLQSLYNFKNNPDDLKAYLNTLERDESEPPTGFTIVDECCGTFNSKNCELIWAIIFFIWFVMSIPVILAEYIIGVYCLIAPAAPTFE